MKRPRSADPGPFPRMGASAMEARQTAERSARFIGIIERLEEGWRVSFRLRLPGEIFTQQGETDCFVSEMQATKWLHTQATAQTLKAVANGEVSEFH
jgi:hypothetical protein